MIKHLNPAPPARPFLKWAGGKTQLLRQLSQRLPAEIKNGEITNYVEPFIGGGAVFFSLTKKFPFKTRYIFDLNEELILVYRVIKKSTDRLIHELDFLESEYISGSNEDRERLFYCVRDLFNQKKQEINFQKYDPGWVTRAAYCIFLNRTCYNGLFRMNRKGEFNVPFGKYKNPRILNKNNLREVACILKKTFIIPGDFTRCKKYVDNKTFVYLDPPYRPLSTTSSFTAYSKDGFSDKDQDRLAGLFHELDKKGAKIMLSNSDPRSENPNDPFFEELYSDYTIERVPARRIINCNGSDRGQINELIITNYR
ncbi:MAG: DNA adenine methylase [Methanoregula sp.]|jgi:DNA adenine methylase|nr:DNA adenine methylase [Methanoregula sp.]